MLAGLCTMSRGGPGGGSPVPRRGRSGNSTGALDLDPRLQRAAYRVGVVVVVATYAQRLWRESKKCVAPQCIPIIYVMVNQLLSAGRTWCQFHTNWANAATVHELTIRTKQPTKPPDSLQWSHGPAGHCPILLCTSPSGTIHG